MYPSQYIFTYRSSLSLSFLLCSAPPGVFLPPSPWAWIDPGAFALIGAGAFMGGVTRMTLALAVIIMEMSNDVRILLPAMVAIMLAKWVADAASHSLYHG